MARETEKERIDREVIELLNELRVTLPGVLMWYGLPLSSRLRGRSATAGDDDDQYAGRVGQR